MAQEKKVSIDDSINRIKEIADKIESGEVELDESIKLFREAKSLAKQTKQELNKAEIEVKKLSEELESEEEELIQDNEGNN